MAATICPRVMTAPLQQQDHRSAKRRTEAAFLEGTTRRRHSGAAIPALRLDVLDQTSGGGSEPVNTPRVLTARGSMIVSLPTTKRSTFFGASARRSTGCPAMAPSAPATAEEIEQLGFGDALQRAQEEGINLFAESPLLSVRTGKASLVPNHRQASGMVMHAVEAERKNKTLTGDFYKRPTWNQSVNYAREKEDNRTLETIARQKRGSVLQGMLRPVASPA